MSVATQSHVVVIIFRWVVAALLIVLTRAVVVSSKLSVPRLLQWNLIVIPWIEIVVSGRRSVSAPASAQTGLPSTTSRVDPCSTSDADWLLRLIRCRGVRVGPAGPRLTLWPPLSRPEPDMVDLVSSSVSLKSVCMRVCNVISVRI